MKMFKWLLLAALSGAQAFAGGTTLKSDDPEKHEDIELEWPDPPSIGEVTANGQDSWGSGYDNDGVDDFAWIAVSTRSQRHFYYIQCFYRQEVGLYYLVTKCRFIDDKNFVEEWSVPYDGDKIPLPYSQ